MHNRRMKPEKISSKSGKKILKGDSKVSEEEH